KSHIRFEELGPAASEIVHPNTPKTVDKSGIAIIIGYSRDNIVKKPAFGYSLGKGLLAEQLVTTYQGRAMATSSQNLLVNAIF
ncbi:unnamed protein product, partial [marine sediment metagenome]